jgi:hypothetical protein
MVDRLVVLPAAGRGTDRELELEKAPRDDEDPSYDRMLLCGGRGTLRFIAI